MLEDFPVILYVSLLGTRDTPLKFLR